MEPSLVNPHSSVMVRYQDGERDGWGGVVRGTTEAGKRSDPGEEVRESD